jgi:hypothetical protein
MPLHSIVLIADTIRMTRWLFQAKRRDGRDGHGATISPAEKLQICAAGCISEEFIVRLSPSSIAYPE